MKRIFLLIILICLPLLTQSVPTYALVLTPPATPTGSADIDPELIKENIKKRIEQAIKNQNTEASKKKVAFIGTLSSVTKNSFNLESASGSIKQASTSATTVFIDLPSNREMKAADVSIGDYLAALGFLNEDTKVLDARRILVLAAPPQLPIRKPVYGTISAIDLKKNSLTLTKSKNGEVVTVVVTAKTNLTVTDGSPHVTSISLKDLKLQAPALIMYLPGKTDKEVNTATTILTYTKTATPSPSPKASPSPTPKPKP